MCFRIALYIFYEQSRGDFFSGCSFITANSSKLSSSRKTRMRMKLFAFALSPVSQQAQISIAYCALKKNEDY